MKVIRVMCSIQEGAIGKTNIKRLEATIPKIYHKHFGAGYKLVFMWLTIPYGQAWLAGKRSTASSIQLPVEDGLPSDRRHPFMAEVCAHWQEITGCNKDEIILASTDFSHYEEFQQVMLQRFPANKQKVVMLKMLMGFGKGWLKKGYLNNSITL
ncbi:hypothetical protein [Parendozoicomonas haliclonae]|uniref:Uncharacterized protein n=1 Tax=Parendozoicomonas haliclonae TaxID=1960125 RepID=A0A1X7ARI0_9GAMM|nr:hypothetical protein [Parendozoicomonas haliclonae]SMA50916.1 hypothetical protein EHSB41UT_04734 [Parendozoicomonas haliclonae]